MINILNMDYRIDDDWCKDVNSKYIKPTDKVLVLALSFTDDEISCNDDWEIFYKKPSGKYYQEIVDTYKSFGIDQEQVIFINYFTQSKKEIVSLIRKSDIIYLPGGIPTGMYEKILELDLKEEIQKFPGLIIGCSAGAMIQFDEYYISPDEDYPSYSVEPGLGLLKGFCIEAHYYNTKVQNEAIKKYKKSTNKTIYGINDQGMVIVEDGKIKLHGDVVKI